MAAQSTDEHERDAQPGADENQVRRISEDITEPNGEQAEGEKVRPLARPKTSADEQAAEQRGKDQGGERHRTRQARRARSR